MRGVITVLTHGAHSGFPTSSEYVVREGRMSFAPFAPNVLRVTLFDTEGGADIHCRSNRELNQALKGA